MSSHGGGGGGHSHSDGCDHDAPERGVEYGLYKKINLDLVTCLNEARDGSGRDVFKPWEQRLDPEKFVESDCDEELLFNIPFTGNVKLKGIIVIGGDLEQHPSKMRLYKNRPQMSFDDVTAAADQEFELQRDPSGLLEYATRVTKFASVGHLSIHFPKNFGADTTTVFYIGLKGDFTEARREEITICSYELAPNPADHKLKHMEPPMSQLGS